jgi:phytoene dehydrogenase-like protein
VTRRAAEIYTGLEDLEIGRRTESPPEAEERLRVTNGCLLHVDLTPSRMGPLRPAFGLGGFRTPVDGLFLGAAGSHPGGGVSGLPGRLAAQEVLRLVVRSESSSRTSTSVRIFADDETKFPPGDVGEPW